MRKEYGIPNEFTRGEIGELWIDTDTGAKYKCNSIATINDGETEEKYYMWDPVRENYKEQAALYESILTGDVTAFDVPDNWTEIRASAFYRCTKLQSITILNNIATIGESAFSVCTSLKSITIPSSVTTIKAYAFNMCSKLTDVTLPSSLTTLGASVFAKCGVLTNVTLGDGFNCDNLNLSASSKYTVDILVGMLAALADRTGQTTYTLTLGTSNLAKLSDEQKAVATAKNWTLA